MLGYGLAILGAAIVAWLTRGLFFDDPYITYRYVRNLHAGIGYCYNPGDLVDVSTSPLHTWLLALAAFATDDIPMAARLLGSVSLAAAGIAFAAIVARSAWVAESDRRWLALIAAALLVSHPGLVATFGIESLLHLALGLSAVLAFVRDARRICAALLALHVLARPDGVLLVGIVAALWALDWLRGAGEGRSLRRLLVPALLFGAILAPWLAFSWLRFGALLPATLGAKTAQGDSGHWRSYLEGIGFWFSIYLLRTVWGYLYYGAALAGALVLGGGARRHLPERLGDGLSVIALWTATHTLAYSLLGVPYYHWYYPLTHLGFLLLATLGALAIARALARLGGGALLAGGAALLSLGVLLGRGLGRLVEPLALPLGHHLVRALYPLRPHPHPPEHYYPQADQSYRELIGALDPTGPPFLFPLLALLAGLVIARLAARGAGEEREAAHHGPLVAILGILLFVGGVSISRSSQAAPPGAVPDYQLCGEWLTRNTAPDATVAAAEIGIIGYHCPNPMIDYLGILSARDAACVAAGDLGSWIERHRPDYFVTHEPAGGFERPAMERAEFRDHYRLAGRLSFEQRADLVIYRREAASVEAALKPRSSP